ncbi:GNAT family N-acetyltransferase [Streptomyces silvensis]|uniref:GNAT family N-acetyltransferase n=1 Tax=Streptomyces silvensis TaxID=1765722 RepID=UPI00099E7AB5|nr:GNAT family N-acetyltransferase [Streptomyces silvensis]
MSSAFPSEQSAQSALPSPQSAPPSPGYRVTGTGLTTARLVLRPWTPAELAAVLDGSRPAGWAPDFPAEGDRVVAGFLTEHPEGLTGYGHRLVTERDGGLVVGSIGLFWPPTDGAIEIGYGIVASRRGRGYASEATRALVAYALTAPGVDTVHATAESANPASVRVLEKAGLRRVGADGDTVTFRAVAGDLARVRDQERQR